MNILSIVNLFSFGIAASNWFMEALIKMLLFFDGVAYTLVAYSFKLFQLMCTLNFNSLYSIVTPILSRIEALVMVFVVYKLGISLINFMLKPEDASKKGKEILINILITAVLLISYNTIFGIFNELSMLMIGVPENYSFTYLGQIADLTESKDSGLINRLVFGTDEQMTDVGEYIAFSMCSLFITNANDPNDTTLLQNQIASDKNPGHADFNKLPNIASQVGKQFDYFTLVGFGVCIYMIYSFVKATIQVGVRAFKILILQILAPIAIITIIGEGVKGKTFKNFLNKYVAVYIELFVRMFSILLISTFVVKFIRNIGDFIANLNSEEWYTYALMIALIILAAFKFAGDIPKFIDEILSTHLSNEKGGFGHFAAGLLGAGVGAVAGFAAGARGGGIGGGIAGLGSGLVGGARSGAKGKNVADFFKGQAQVGKDAKAKGQDIAAHGGLMPYIGGGIENRVGVGAAHDRALAKLDKQSRALDELEAAEKFAVKDSKMGSGKEDLSFAKQQIKAKNPSISDADLETQAKRYYSDTYSTGYDDIKLGEDKDTYAAKMLDYDKEYQNAQANYDNLSSDTSSITPFETDYSKAVQEASDVTKDKFTKQQYNYQTYQYDTVFDQKGYDAAKDAAEKKRAAAEDALNKAKEKREADIAQAKTAAEEARHRATNRAKDYYDARKRYEGDQSKDVQRKRMDYESVAPKSDYKDSAGRTIERSDATKRTDEKRRIYEEKAAIKNKPSYDRTHGGSSKK